MNYCVVRGCPIISEPPAPLPIPECHCNSSPNQTVLGAFGGLQKSGFFFSRLATFNSEKSISENTGAFSHSEITEFLSIFNFAQNVGI